MNVFKKIKWFFAVAIIFLVILATNQIDRRNFTQVEDSVEKIFNERLLAKEYLLKISIKFHEKELAYALNNKSYLQLKNETINNEIEELLQNFDRVEATRKEEITLMELTDNHKRLMQFESTRKSDEVLYTPACAAIFTAINANIAELSAEQIAEGKNQKLFARNAVDSIKLLSQIEIYILFGLAIMLLFILFYSPKKKNE
jgi:hypothetical protein